MSARRPFTTPPRDVPVSAVLRQGYIWSGLQSGCFRRMAECPALLWRGCPRVYRWLCAPAGFPTGEG